MGGVRQGGIEDGRWRGRKMEGVRKWREDRWEGEEGKDREGRAIKV